jgi:hypothetical protein
MARPRITQIAIKLQQDIDPSSKIDVKILDAHVNKVVLAATEALKNHPIGFGDIETSLISRMYSGLRFTHMSIRELLARGSDDPRCVDAFSLSRLQLETLYSLALILEQPKYATDFAKFGWKKMYVRFLLEREERQDLPRFSEFSNKIGPNHLESLRILSGVTDQERLTIEVEELGTAMPKGFKTAKIPNFPLPSRIIDSVQQSTLKQTLQRLYPEYEFLCSFTHSSVEAMLLKTFMDRKSPYRNFLPQNAGEHTFQNQVAEPAILYDFLSLAQAGAELTRLYTTDVQLVGAVADAWSWLIESTLIGRSIWQIRTKKLLSVF